MLVTQVAYPPPIVAVTEVVPHPVFALQVTLPVAAKRPCPFTPLNPNCVPIVAVNITLCPYTDGFVLLVTPTVVVAPFTFCVSVAVLAP
jgi:hypothetical protein